MQILLARAISRFLAEQAEEENILSLADGVSPALMLADAARHLEKSTDDLAEDLGAWLVRQEEIWRLLRFCGQDLLDFLLRLEELPDRIRLLSEDMTLPRITLSRSSDGLLWVTFSDPPSVWTALMSGLLRAMADEYGALCVITPHDDGLSIDISDSAFAAARIFHLSPRVAGQ